MWIKGFCIGAKGNSCKFRHYYNEMDAMIKVPTKQLQVPTNRINQSENYSSPYRVKVVKEVSEQRKVEVDLETGKRNSWVEVTEYEVLDLTGETPNKKLPLVESRLKDPNKAVRVSSNKATDVSVKKPIAAALRVKQGTCPVCYRVFKGDRGVVGHRGARSSSCNPDKENQVDQQNLANIEDPVTPHSLPGRKGNSSYLNRIPVEVSSPIRGGLDDSVIVLPDTPFPVNRRRRSIR